MGNRESVHLKMDEDVYERFVSYVIEAHGQKYGNLGREAENAFIEYIDNDRAARIERKVDRLLALAEENQDTHTHKQTETVKKAENIADSIEATGRTVIPTEDVRRAIENVAGGDDRTVRKYEDVLRRRGLAYNHPTDSVWTMDRDEWLKWAVEHVNNNPTVSRTDVIKGYPIGYDEIEELATEVLA